MPLISTFAGITISGFVYNACGVNDEIFAQLKKLVESESGAVLLKSVSKEPRKGNQNPKYIVKSNLVPGCTVNSIGLSNKGLQQNLQYTKDLKEITDKPILVSLTNFSNQESYELLEAFLDQGLVDGIEINISCPNVGSKGLLGYYPDKVDKFLEEVQTKNPQIPIGLKLPPYFEEVHFDEISEILLARKISFIATTNTLGGALVINPEKESTIIKPNFGRGGLGGDYLKPIALGNVNSFYRRLKEKVDIVGVGGVGTGKDAFEFLLAGASCVQVGSSFAQEGYGIFDKINRELAEILERKGYKSIEEAKGKLKFL